MTQTTVADRLPWWRYLGPWPLRPGAMFFAVLIFAIATNTASIRVSNSAVYLGAAVAVSIVGAGTLWLFQRYAPVWSGQPLGYTVALASATVLVTAARGVTGTWVTFAQVSPVMNVVLIILRSMLFAVVVLALLGVTSLRLQRQVERTEAALGLVREQADALLRADETVRQQVAALLHDRVQAGLIASCLHLQDVRSRIPDSERAEIGEIITALERIRALDVRRAVHSLSPNLAEVDFESALRELAEFYEPAITTTIDLDLAEDTPYEIRLGAYRIIEQALLNAAAHGGGRHCTVHARERDSQVVIDVINDGMDLPENISSGMGTTLTSTWCRTLGGTWERTNLEGGGVRLSARLPLRV